ncbi:Uma2 family endonuclease [Cryptosporangium sp. NPDC048952]|uniref:Uma2 family endonuclease n=1 Tax=Cryptosporangium sp. NPDC048952 TaxID=3363961 RepID=UPI00371AA6B6
MSRPMRKSGISVDEWLAACEAAGPGQRVEIVDGEFVMRRVGGNPHHFVSYRIAEEFMRQWPGVIASPPAHWGLEFAEDGEMLTSRVPDVLVDGDSLVNDPVFVGVPQAVAEVWSPNNTLKEMNRKRREYREGGAPIFVEAFLTDTLDVHLEWLVLEGDRWVSVAAASGASQLRVGGSRPFSVVPNALLRPQ